MTIAEELEQAKTQLAGQKTQLDALILETTTLRTLNTTLSTAAAASASDLATLRTQNSTLTKENLTLSTEVATLRTNADKLASAKALEITQGQGIPLETVKSQIKENPEGAEAKPKTAALAVLRCFRWNDLVGRSDDT